uniref:(northern house mosquito) hypothetical protein n=1 Tax=Culex pipiens TaxID=7175 RepID=A0A8D8HHJ2_CULPI
MVRQDAHLQLVSRHRRTLQHLHVILLDEFDLKQPPYQPPPRKHKVALLPGFLALHRFFSLILDILRLRLLFLRKLVLYGVLRYRLHLGDYGNGLLRCGFCASRGGRCR